MPMKNTRNCLLRAAKGALALLLCLLLSSCTRGGSPEVTTFDQGMIYDTPAPAQAEPDAAVVAPAQPADPGTAFVAAYTVIHAPCVEARLTLNGAAGRSGSGSHISLSSGEQG